MSEHDCPVGRLERAVSHHVADVSEALARAGWEQDRATAYIADRIGRAARQGLAIGAAGIAASAGIEDDT